MNVSVDENVTVAIVGSGPAGLYAADILLQQHPLAQIDMFEKLPAPFGLVRYGVAPDHPRIKMIQDTLQGVLEHPRIRLLSNVEVGVDVSVEELRAAYDGVVIATGADRNAKLGIPGEQLPGSFGAADFVAWYDGHPDAADPWPLEAESVAVIGAGNVALDISRMLIKHAEHLSHTDVPGDVESGFQANRIRDLHMFIRRGPADVRFSPMELRELGAQLDVDIIVDPADVVLDEHAKRMVAQFSPVRLVVQALTEWAQADPATRRASRRVHLHFYHQPARILGTNQVKGLELERTAPDELGRISGTGERVRFDVGSVYSAIGYRSTPIPGVPFDERRMTVPERDGRVLDTDGSPVPGLYATGWIRRGPVGLIGATKSDASQTIASLLADLAGDRSRAPKGAVDALRKRLVDAVDREGWLRIDAAERNLGARRGRDRTKIAERGALLHHASALDAG